MAEVGLASFGIRQGAIFHHLQEHIVDLRMRFFDFIQQHDTIRPPFDRLRELACLVIADVARRGSNEARGVVALHEL